MEAAAGSFLVAQLILATNCVIMEASSFASDRLRERLATHAHRVVGSAGFYPPLLAATQPVHHLQRAPPEPQRRVHPAFGDRIQLLARYRVADPAHVVDGLRAVAAP